ncbi:bifunctional protein FolD 1, mitochondrial [Diospyros lotus]|uniref:bifunctional protein FolD 1, mitochondrial n=1 Tax=Diospyros lotus TaxID=55363 RepID=UPI00225BFDA5|nr:bifunctional protein FolD 1, mitochondrial [Diospyros lotus]XP_052175534.1 bifunctional protein FolD 1, mitochondrial [Diospyros lotus]
MALIWYRWLSRSFQSQSVSRALSTLKGDSSQQIIKSPPLLSLDLPDIWTSNSMHYDPLDIDKYSNESRARVIDGKLMAEKVTTGIAGEVIRMQEAIGMVPGLAVILVGQRKDSETYVRNKRKACEESGINFWLTKLPGTCTEHEIHEALSSYNENPSVHGILVQLPLPRHLDEEKILNALSLEKDVDGFHPLNMGNLAMTGREPLFIPCTPKGCVELLLRSDVEIMGKKAVVIGRSNIVGLPVSLLLQRHHATVSTVHALSKNPDQVTRQADIVITAAGVPNLVRGTWLKLGAVVIDVGTYPVKDPDSRCGYRLIGDVCYEEAVKVASAITPVPGGVGPMTIAMLLANTLESAKRAYSFS